MTSTDALRDYGWSIVEGEHRGAPEPMRPGKGELGTRH